MKTTLRAAALAVLPLAGIPAAHAASWQADPGHTEVRVYYNHAGFSEQSIEFGEFTGTLHYSDGDVAGAKADFAIPVASVVTGVEMFDNDLRGGTFFDVETYPEIRFVSTAVEQTGESSAKVTGDLTIKDVTKPATFDVTLHNIGPHPVGQVFDFYKGTWLGITAVSEINRSEWNMGAFVPIGSDKVRIVINAELKAQE